jgi:hypothetical protein
MGTAAWLRGPGLEPYAPAIHDNGPESRRGTDSQGEARLHAAAYVGHILASWQAPYAQAAQDRRRRSRRRT